MTLSGEDDRAAAIEATLRGALEPEHLEVCDEGAQHRGHAGAASGGGHFRVTIVSQRFDSKSRIARHRLLYDALGDAMRSEIHALSIRALTPEEWKAS